MTTMQLNAEMLRNMSIIAEDENLLKRATKYLRKLVAETEKEIAEGKGITFTNKDDMNAWLDSL